jgi:hypothetical protein
MGGLMKQFCPFGHDTFIVGRKKNRACSACSELKIKTWALKHPENKKKAQHDWYNRRGKAYRLANPAKTLEWRRKQDWKGVINYFGNQITSSDYNAAHFAQNGRCANKACRQDKKLHMDHNHSTMRFRGLLCGSCNRTLGLCHDSPEVLLGLANYIENQGVYDEKTAI